MSQIIETVDVDVPVRTAYDQWTQFESFPMFMEGVENVEQLDDTTLRWTAEIAGQKRSWKAKITEQLPDERVAWTSIDGAKGILFNITAGKDITLQEVQKAAEIVRSAADPGANIIFGVVRDDTMAGEIKITVIATGFGAGRRRRRAGAEPQVAVPSAGSEQAENGLDVPSFLRGE